MTYKETKKLLFEKLKTKLKYYGFKGKLLSDGYQFYRKTPFGKQYIGGGIVNYIDEFNTSVHIGSRFDIVENIYNTIIEASPIYIKDSMTLGVTYSNYLKVNSFAFEIFNEKDIDTWVEEVMLFLNQFGFEFLDKYYEIEQLDEQFNKLKNSLFFQPNPPIQDGCKGLIIAKLVNNPEFEKLKEKYLFQYQDNGLKHLLEKTIDFLAKHNRDELLKI